MIIRRIKKIRAERDTIFNKVNRESIRVMIAFKATKPKRDTVVYRYEERKG